MAEEIFKRNGEKHLIHSLAYPIKHHYELFRDLFVNDMAKGANLTIILG